MNDSEEVMLLLSVWAEHVKLLTMCARSVSYGCNELACGAFHCLCVTCEYLSDLALCTPPVIALAVLLLLPALTCAAVRLYNVADGGWARAGLRWCDKLTGSQPNTRRSGEIRDAAGEKSDVSGVFSDASASCTWRGIRAAACAVQGLRPAMEDRFAADEMSATALSGHLKRLHQRTDGEIPGGCSLYAVFDGHGGQFAADYARKHLISAVKRHLSEALRSSSYQYCTGHNDDATSGGDNCNYAEDASLQRTVSSGPPTDNNSHCCATVLPSTGEKLNYNEKSTADVDQDSSSSCPKQECNESPTDLPSNGQDVNHSLHNSPLSAGASMSGCRLLTDVYDSTSMAGRRLTACDGGGRRVDLHAPIVAAFSAVDAELLRASAASGSWSGTTAVLAVWLHRLGQLLVAGCGDSRAVLLTADGRVRQLTVDHKPNLADERRRIVAAGGFVSLNGVWRVNGLLATSRALGDLPFKQRHLLSCEPHVTLVDLGQRRRQSHTSHSHSHAQEDSSCHRATALVLATDGLWDVLQSHEVLEHTAGLPAPAAAARLVQTALRRGSSDNVTVMVVQLS